MSWLLTVKTLREQLSRYSDDAIVMVATPDEPPIIYDAMDDVTHGYRSDDGEVFTEVEARDDEALSLYKRAVVIWPNIK